WRDERDLGGWNQCGIGPAVGTRAGAPAPHTSCARGVSVPCPGSTRNFGNDERGIGPRGGPGATEFSSRRTVCGGGGEDGAQTSRETGLGWLPWTNSVSPRSGGAVCRTKIGGNVANGGRSGDRGA